MDKTWIQAFGKMTYGIYVLTTFYEDQINAMIASWVSQASFDPPLMMAAIHPSRYSHRLIEKSRCFALHIPAKHQRAYLSRFKGPDPAAKFDGIQWIKAKSGCPILNQCVAYVECRVRDSYRPGNHTLFIGEVIEARQCSDEEPFSSLDYEGQYLGQD